MPNIDYIKLHIFTAKNASASLHEGRKNVGRASFSVGEKESEECFVFVLTRSVFSLAKFSNYLSQHRSRGGFGKPVDL